jgi:hypothetical protein
MGVVATVLGLFVEIGAAIRIFFEQAILHRLESVPRTPRWKGKLSPLPKFPLTRKSKRMLGSSPVAHNELGQQEIERRRNLVRTLFNDFWSREDEKLALFTARLDQAEDYLTSD